MENVWDRRENNFDFIRLALAVLVIYSHAFPLGTGSEAEEPFARMTHGQLTGGALAVDLFFIMSGFLIAASAQRSSSVWSFLGKRVRRIYPAFVVGMVLSALVIMPLAGARFAESHVVGRVLDFVVNTLRLRQFGYEAAFAGNPFPGEMNGSVWSIPFEFWCYLGVAALSVVGLLRVRTVRLLFVIAWVVGVMFRVKGWLIGGKLLGAVFGYPVLWARLLPLYLAGMLFYLYRDRIPKKSWMMAVAAGLLLLGAMVPWGMSVVFPVAGTYLIFALAYTRAGGLSRFGRFGDFSYGTYLYGFPVEQMVMRWLGHPVPPHVLFLLATPLTLVLAAGSWYGVERWFLPQVRRVDRLEVLEAARVGTEASADPVRG